MDIRFFQWQNESLLKTIYPLREMKLRDFLYFFAEIDLWQAYKDKPLAALEEDIRAHHETQARLVREAVDNLTRLEEYFLTPDVRAVYAAKFAAVDEAELAKINLIHAAFARYYPNFNDPRKEKYFIAQQITGYEPRRGEITKLIAQRQRRLDAIAPAHPTRPTVQAEIEKLKTVTMPMADEEYNRLRDFLAAHAKLESRKMEIARGRQDAAALQKTLTQRLTQNLARQRPLEAQRQSAADEITRLANPPELAPLEAYFFTEDVSTVIRDGCPNAAPEQVRIINDLHKEIKSTFQYTKAPAARLRAIKTYIYNLQQSQKTIDKQISQLETSLRNMGPAWKRKAEVEAQLKGLRETQPALVQEVGRLNDYWAALNASIVTPAERARQLQEKEAAFAQLDQTWKQLTAEAADLQQQLQGAAEVLNTSEAGQLLQAAPAKPLTVKDIVRGKLETYKAELAQKDHVSLLEEIVQRFIREPDRFPLWLQYMVLHFSGMRYRSAHGSWADPRDLLANLRTSAVEQDFKSLDDASKDAILEHKLIAYGVVQPPAASPGSSPDPAAVAPTAMPRLAQTTSRRWREKLDHHLRTLQNPSEYHRRKALFEFLMDEANYEVEAMTTDEATDALEALKDTLPAWMWKEIVKVTDLRLEYVDDDNWENLDAQEQAEKGDARWQDYRLMISKWKEGNVTAWKDEHNQSNQLIVTSAVCNETAEHIQHIRGNNPPGGLTAKPKWYMRLESEAAGLPVPPGDKLPHFIKPAAAQDFAVGASVLWLRFVNEMPNPWRIAPPLVLKNGDGLLPAQFFGGGQQEGGWVYQQMSNVISRKRNTLDAKGKKVGEEQQYLRWIHEATVAAVGETADGPVVLTFETALPNEDKRLSSIGVFKHYLHNIVYGIRGEWFNASFIGYTPEDDIPSEDLEFMLDWNKILLKEALPPAELEAYKKKYFYRKYKALTGYGG
jgi:hypothetical protein